MSKAFPRLAQWTGFLTLLFALILPAAASAEGGRKLQLLESPPLEVEGSFEKARPVSETGLKREIFEADLFDGIFPFSKPAKQDDEPGCRIDPSSPAIGADVPLTYFGVPSPALGNPSLVGALQLLTSGPLNVEDRTITLPLYLGRMFGTNDNVWFIATDSTDQVNAAALGLNQSAKLAYAETGRGTRTARIGPDGVLVFEQGTVDFSPERIVVPGPLEAPFPPAQAQPGSVGDSEYTPLVKILNAGGHIYNMPVIAWGPPESLLNDDGTPNRAYVHDSVVDIDLEEETVTMALASGFSFGRPVLYISTDANSPVAAALEASTLAPGLDDIDVGNDDSLFSAVERIFIITNGEMGCENPHRQGLYSALIDGVGPFNILGGIPTIAADYSPLWDGNFGEWTQQAIDDGVRARLIDEFQYLSFVEFGFLTGPGGSEFGSSGVIINCPAVFRFL